MTERNLTLPGNLRYQPKKLKGYFGYDNLYYGLAWVEIATLETLVEIGVIPEIEAKTLVPELKEKLLVIPTTDVDIVERKLTKHDVRAWVRTAQDIMRNDLARWVHIPLTSYDSLDTGRIFQYRMAYQQVLRPSIEEVVGLLADLVEKFAGQLQIGRTHGQHALPITVGFWLATVLQRILHNWREMDQCANALVGKISGAVGAYNAQIGLYLERRCGNKTFEERVLEKLGLGVSAISTQILPPEPLAYFLFSCSMMSASFAQLGRDCRHLMRTEIAEVREEFEEGQVGSSTMAHKRNPISFESMEGMWLKTKNEFGKVLDTLISEHQRDLVGSSVARDFPIILVNLQKQLDTLSRKNNNGVPFLSRISIDKEACERNFEKSANLILAEPLYIALIMGGYQGDAHELVNHTLVPEAKKSGQSLVDILERMPDSQNILKKIPGEIIKLLRSPRDYTGSSECKAKLIVNLARQQINSL